jgi:hypothetical protein
VPTDDDHYILGRLDNLLRQVAGAGREPVHLAIEREAWLSLKVKLDADLLPEPAAFGTNTYKGVPVHFNIGADRRIYVMDTTGERIFGD